MVLPIACILAGGRSSRFGTNKARAVVNGRIQILRIADMVRPLATEVIVAADTAEKYADLGLRSLADAMPFLGPAGGLKTALQYAGLNRWVLLISCDFLEIRPHWIQTLVTAASPAPNRSELSQAVGPLAVAYRHSHWEPTPALYHGRAFTRIARTNINQCGPGINNGFSGSMQRILDLLHATALSLPVDWPETPQFNSPEQLNAYTSGRHAGASAPKP